MTKRILIVDDEPNIVISLEYLDEARGLRGGDRARRRGGAGGAAPSRRPIWWCST